MEQVEYEMVLQCSGNGRFMYADIPGTPWTLGGVGNVRFMGVPLSAVLEKHDVEIDPQVKYVTAESREGPHGERATGSGAQPAGGGRRREEHSRAEAQR